MKIGFDGKRAVQNMRGLGNYSRYMLEILCEYYPENSYVLYAPRMRENARLEELLQRYPQIEVCTPQSGFWKKMKSIWRSLGVTKQAKNDGVELFHGLSAELPFNVQKGGFKSIVTVHDLIFLKCPEYYKPIDRWIYGYKIKKACQSADLVIAISECTKHDIVEQYGISPDKIKVLYQGCDKLYRKPQTEEQKDAVKTKYNLPEEYILYVGQLDPHKNAMLIVKAMEQLDKDLHLVIVGHGKKYKEQIISYCNAHGLNDRVHVISGVPFEDLPALYQMADMYVLPSFYEGFGIPPLEALCSRTPVIAAKGSCLEESGGPDSLYVDPNSVEDLVAAVNTIRNNPEKRQQMIERGVQWSQQFQDENVARNLMAIYQEVIEG